MESLAEERFFSAFAQEDRSFRPDLRKLISYLVILAAILIAAVYLFTASATMTFAYSVLRGVFQRQDVHSEAPAPPQVVPIQISRRSGY
jgi:hypothetical protein